MKHGRAKCPVARNLPYRQRTTANLYTTVGRPKASGKGDKLHDAMLGCVNARSGYLALLCWKRACSGDLLGWAVTPLSEGRFKGHPAGHVAVFHRDYVMHVAGVPKCGPAMRELVEMTTRLYEACSTKAVEFAEDRRRRVLRRWRAAAAAVVCTHRMWRVLDLAARRSFAADLARETATFGSTPIAA
jgi:hypothetical protein